MVVKAVEVVEAVVEEVEGREAKDGAGRVNVRMVVTMWCKVVLDITVSRIIRTGIGMVYMYILLKVLMIPFIQVV